MRCQYCCAQSSCHKGLSRLSVNPADNRLILMASQDPFSRRQTAAIRPASATLSTGSHALWRKGLNALLGALDPCDRAGAERAVVFRGVRTVQKLNSVAQPPQTGLPATLHARRDAPFARLRRGDCGGADRRRCALGERPCGRCIRTRVRSQRGAGTHGPPASRSSMVLGAGNWD